MVIERRFYGPGAWRTDLVRTFDTVSALGGVSVTGRAPDQMPDHLVNSGFVTPEGDPIFVPERDKSFMWMLTGPLP